MFNNNTKTTHYCCICGLKINQGNYCIGHQAAYQHAYYEKSQGRYDRIKQLIKKNLVLLQAGPAMGLIVDEAKLKTKISKLQAKLQEMEKLNPGLKTEPGKEE